MRNSAPSTTPFPAPTELFNHLRSTLEAAGTAGLIFQKRKSWKRAELPLQRGDLAYLNTGKELQFDFAALWSGRKPGRLQNAADAGGRPLEPLFQQPPPPSHLRGHGQCSLPAPLGPAARQPGWARRPELPPPGPPSRPPAASPRLSSIEARPSPGCCPGRRRRSDRLRGNDKTRSPPPAPPTPGSSGEGSTCPPPRPGTAPAAGSPRDRCAQPTPTAELQGRPPAPQSRRPSCAAVAEREEPSNLPSSPRSAQCAAAAPEPPQSPSRLGRTCREEEEPQSAVAGPVPCRCLRRCSCPSSRTTVRPSALHRPGPAEAVLRDGSGKEARAGLGNNSRSGAET